MIRAKNYETVSTFVNVMQKKTLASFFPDTVYTQLLFALWYTLLNYVDTSSPAADGLVCSYLCWQCRANNDLQRQFFLLF